MHLVVNSYVVHAHASENRPQTWREQLEPGTAGAAVFLALGCCTRRGPPHIGSLEKVVRARVVDRSSSRGLGVWDLGFPEFCLRGSFWL